MADELCEGDGTDIDGDFSVNPNVPKNEVLTNLLEGHSSRFRNVTGFSIEEFDELCRLVKPIIELHSRSTGLAKRKKGRPSKTSINDRVLNCILMLKYVSAFWYDFVIHHCL
jgi:hypothetical protein